MSSRSPRSATACKVGSSRMESPRFAPSMTQPMGAPNRSVATDHFHPILALSVGLGPVASPPHGALCRLPSTATSDRSRDDDLVVAGDGFFDELVEHPSGEPFCAQG